MPKFRKKPVIVEARLLTRENAAELAAWCNGRLYTVGLPAPQVAITTLEGVMIARPGDWIIKGVNGEFYPCKPDVFAMTYEPVAE